LAESDRWSITLAFQGGGVLVPVLGWPRIRLSARLGGRAEPSIGSIDREARKRVDRRPKVHNLPFVPHSER